MWSHHLNQELRVFVPDCHQNDLKAKTGFKTQLIEQQAHFLSYKSAGTYSQEKSLAMPNEYIVMYDINSFSDSFKDVNMQNMGI